MGISYTDKRIRAAVMMSPSIPRRGDAGRAFGQVHIPWMLLTGTEDDSPIGDVEPESRRRVFPALPPGGKYELVLDGGQHSAFSDRPLPGDRARHNPNHHRVILALTTAFWDAHLRGDERARTWLQGEGALGLLERGDLCQTK